MPRLFGILLASLLCAPGPAIAQDAVPSQAQSEDEAGPNNHRIFGVLPNHTTVERDERVQPVSTKDVFHLAAQDAFDPPVFPFVAFTTWVAGVQGEEASWGEGPSAFAKRYAITFSDHTIATFMTTAIMPALLHQDPRYYRLGGGNPWHRAGYAATRSFVTRGRSGHRQFNTSDVTGNAIAASLSDFYHPAEDRSLPDTVMRWETLMMWDVLSCELKEFWPDIRRLGRHNKPFTP